MLDGDAALDEPELLELEPEPEPEPEPESEPELEELLEELEVVD